ncbi:ATP-binding cassette domain-containing protein [Brevibacillus composti]|uniref:ATP-binding cassette domain-containing protein n=1 Tax=Brevibacillus composti TaxID=2796470 RepID=A0A7T5JPS6_9BACL|nr:ATP-binding cassette domain-containing protein [Brevibacillus composti]QQE75376.1 ATP-binding cassette domain-containing protein [Brevibacillus composti]QUO42402.1 ATP-binding cassette domain-containing protein [Brevibacillus composti]
MIQVKELCFRYPGSGAYTLRDISFSIGSGEIFGFLGPSGAGKSTLQKILIGMLRQYEGEAIVLGEEIRQTRSDFYQRIGVAFEFPNFYGRFTALENLELFRSLYAGKAKAKSPLAMLEEGRQSRSSRRGTAITRRVRAKAKRPRHSYGSRRASWSCSRPINTAESRLSRGESGSWSVFKSWTAAMSCGYR